MKLTDIVAITGIGGLHKIIGRTKSGLIVETLAENGKRFPTAMQDKVSVLDDISMYTESGDMKLGEVLLKIHENGDVPSAKESPEIQRNYLIKTIQLDSERVYDSDIKKLLSWYHILKNITDIAALVTPEEESTDTNVTPEAAAEPAENVAEKPKTKKVSAKKAASDESAETTPKAKAPRKKKSEE